MKRFRTIICVSLLFIKFAKRWYKYEKKKQDKK